MNIYVSNIIIRYVVAVIKPKQKKIISFSFRASLREHGRSISKEIHLKIVNSSIEIGYKIYYVVNYKQVRC
jgi:hypothetical protein